MDTNISNYFNKPKTEIRTSTPAISNFYSPVTAVPSAAPVQYHVKDRNVKVTDKDLDAMRPLIYGEISNRTPDKQNIEAHVIVNTALNRQKEYTKRGLNKTLSDVVAMPNQYQAYGGPQYQNYFNPQNPIELAKKKQVDTIVDSIRDKIKNGEFVDNTEGAYYYVHEKGGKIKYDNLKKLFAK